MASLDQIVPGKGYSEDNRRLVCYGYNQLKKKYTDEEVKDLIKAYGSGEAIKEKLHFTGEFREKINDMIGICRRMDKKMGHNLKLTVEDVEELI